MLENAAPRRMPHGMEALQDPRRNEVQSQDAPNETGREIEQEGSRNDASGQAQGRTTHNGFVEQEPATGTETRKKGRRWTDPIDLLSLPFRAPREQLHRSKIQDRVGLPQENQNETRRTSSF